jgi:hypothetical protein
MPIKLRIAMFRPDPKPTPTPKKKQKPIKQISNKRRERLKGGKAPFFTAILEKRRHVSWLTNKPIELVSFTNCAHCVPAGDPKYQDLCELDEENVLLLTDYEHFLADHGTKSLREKYAEQCKEEGYNCDWSKWYNYKEMMKTKYDEIINKQQI